MANEKIVKVSVILITLLIAYFLITQISLTMVITSIFSVNAAVLLASFILYSLTNVFRAIRYSIMLEKPLRENFYKIFNIVCIHNMANNLFPFRSGELTFVYLAKVQLKIATGVGAATVVLSRIYDVLVICLLILFIILLFPGNYGIINSMTFYIAIVGLCLFLLIFSFIVLNRLFITFAASIYKRIKNRLVQGFYERILEISKFYSGAHYSANILPQILVTFAIWVVTVLSIYLLASGMGISICAWAIIIGTMIVVVAGSIPVQGIANLGSFELIWSFVFIALGVPNELAISSGFAVHILILLFAAVLWLYTFVTDRLKGRHSLLRTGNNL